MSGALDNLEIKQIFYQRVLKLVGGVDTEVERWWNTPIPYPPFSFRAPYEFLNEREINTLKLWLLEATSSGGIDDLTVDFNITNNLGGASSDKDDPLAYNVIANGGNVSEVLYEVNKRDRITYRIHRFTSSSTFSVITGGTIEYLIVGGGGGGGGGTGGGGGGGGGVRIGTMNVGAGEYDIIVGSGGSRSNGVDNIPTNGRDSSAFSIIAPGGGRGASVPTVLDNGNPGTGGPGGGGSKTNTQGAIGTSLGLETFSFKGGTGYTPTLLGGGGAGAGGAGGDATETKAGNGGQGILSNITGVDVTYGGGGGGGSGGTDTLGGTGRDGGGSGRNANLTAANSSNGSANRGGGGGGGTFAGFGGGNGGSGVVIIRYPYSTKQS